MSAIYAIKNLVNNKVYIGSSKSPKRRRTEHFYQLKKGKHHSIHLQRAYDEYGKDKFSFYILEECDDDNRKEREMFYINESKAFDRDYGYNIIEVNDAKFNCSEETKDKIANSYESKIRIDLYDVEGNFIKTFRSIRACSLEHNLQTSKLSRILDGRRKSTHGYVVVKHGEPFSYVKSRKPRRRKV